MAISPRATKLWKSHVINRIDKRIHDLRCAHTIERSSLSSQENEQASSLLSDAVTHLSARRDQLAQEMLSITTQAQLDEILGIVVGLTSNVDNPFIDEPLPFFADE